MLFANDSVSAFAGAPGHDVVSLALFVLLTITLLLSLGSLLLPAPEPTTTG